MSDGFLIFASQVSILGSLLIVAVIYGGIVVLQALVYTYHKLHRLYQFGVKLGRTYIHHAQKKKPAISSKTTMIGA